MTALNLRSPFQPPADSRRACLSEDLPPRGELRAPVREDRAPREEVREPQELPLLRVQADAAAHAGGAQVKAPVRAADEALHLGLGDAVQRLPRLHVRV